MEESLKSQYRALVRYIDPPIQEIVSAIWDLPFIVDTGVTCSGHVLVQSSYPNPSSLLPWDRLKPVHYKYHPAGACLGLVFSAEAEMVERCNLFRRDLQSILVKEGNIEFQFGSAKRFGRLADDTYKYEYYETKRPPNETTTRKVESLLVSFWEEVAVVLRKYNPRAQIGSIKGKNFRDANTFGRWDIIKLYDETRWLAEYKG